MSGRFADDFLRDLSLNLEDFLSWIDWFGTYNVYTLAFNSIFNSLNFFSLSFSAELLSEEFIDS